MCFSRGLMRSRLLLEKVFDFRLGSGSVHRGVAGWMNMTTSPGLFSSRIRTTGGRFQALRRDGYCPSLNLRRGRS